MDQLEMRDPYVINVLVIIKVTREKDICEHTGLLELPGTHLRHLFDIKL